MNVKIGAEAVLFPEKEYISGIFVAVSQLRLLKTYPTEKKDSHKAEEWFLMKQFIAFKWLLRYCQATKEGGQEGYTNH